VCGQRLRQLELFFLSLAFFPMSPPLWLPARCDFPFFSGCVSPPPPGATQFCCVAVMTLGVAFAIPIFPGPLPRTSFPFQEDRCFRSIVVRPWGPPAGRPRKTPFSSSANISFLPVRPVTSILFDKPASLLSSVGKFFFLQPLIIQVLPFFALRYELSLFPLSRENILSSTTGVLSHLIPQQLICFRVLQPLSPPCRVGPNRDPPHLLSSVFHPRCTPLYRRTIPDPSPLPCASFL